MSIFPLTFIFIAAISSFGQLQDPQFEPGWAEINAFIYRHEQNVWIASDEPALKSCCRASIAKADRQILLEIELGDLPAFEALSDGRSALISGVIERESSPNASPKWVMKKAHLKKVERGEGETVAAIAFGCTLIVFIILGWTWKKSLLPKS